MTDAFGLRLARALAARGPLCVGIDPHPYLMDAWGLGSDAAGLESFSRAVVEASAGRVAAVKPQVAFFERRGAAGFAVLERVIADARAAGLIVIADAKRGDIGSSVEGYADAWLAPGAPFESDALTVSPYLGVGSLAPVTDAARAHGRGVFVLAATSNAEARELQSARLAGGAESVAASIVREVRALAPDRATPVPTNSVPTTSVPALPALADVGVVIGATTRLDRYGLTAADVSGLPILAPGFGHQGASLAELGGIFGVARGGVLAAVSRSVLEAGPRGIHSAIDRHRDEAGA